MDNARLDLMHRYLDAHADEIARLPTGQVHFDLGAGVAVSAYITRYDKLRRPDGVAPDGVNGHALTEPARTPRM